MKQNTSIYTHAYKPHRGTATPGDLKSPETDIKHGAFLSHVPMSPILAYHLKHICLLI